MNYFTVTKYNDNLYQLKDKLGVLVTLVIGNEKALLFDTAYGIGDLKKEVEQITKLPLVVVNSHGHMDHSCGNYLFDSVYIHNLDVDLCKLHNSIDWRVRNLHTAKNMNLINDSYNQEKYINAGFSSLKPLNYHDKFDLGDISIEVVNMEGHTKGSVGFLIKEDKLLVTSDAACPFVWLFLEESTTVKTYVEMLTNVLKLDFDGFLVGHGVGKILPRTKIEDFLDCAKNIDLEKSVKVSFNNFDHLNSYCYTLGKMYDQNDVGVVFDPNKIK